MGVGQRSTHNAANLGVKRRQDFVRLGSSCATLTNALDPRLGCQHNKINVCCYLPWRLLLWEVDSCSKAPFRMFWTPFTSMDAEEWIIGLGTRMSATDKHLMKSTRPRGTRSFAWEPQVVYFIAKKRKIKQKSDKKYHHWLMLRQKRVVILSSKINIFLCCGKAKTSWIVMLIPTWNWSSL